MRNVVIVIAVGLLILAGVWFALFYGGSEVSRTSNVSIDDIDQSVTEQVLREGKASAPVTIIEYIDYKCPNCNRFHQNAGKELRERFVKTGQAQFEYRAFPFLGPDSGRALRGAFCANSQNKFVAYHDAVLQFMWERYYQSGEYSAEIEDILSEDVLSSVASNVGIQKVQFRECITSEEQNSNIDRDILEAADDEVMGTPTFVVGGQKIVGPQPLAVFEKVIQAQQ